MASAQNRLLGVLFVSGLLSCGLGACSSDTDNGSGSTGGSGGSGSGSASSAGGGSSSVASSASGGSQGGKSSSGGQSSSSSSSKGGDSGGKTTEDKSSGGSTTKATTEVSSSGGSTASTTGGKGGGTGTGGKGGDTGTGSGGAGGKGGGTAHGTGGAGGAATGGTTSAGGAGGSSTSSTPSGSCQKGVVKAKDVVIMGESFYAMAPNYIQKRIEQNAQKAGVIAAGESYRNVAVSGQSMNYIATTEWDNASKSPPKVVIMDGGGIDCMSSSCPTCPDTLKTLFGKMATAGVQQVIYTRYPEPGAPPGSDAKLKGNLDALMPKMQPVCEGATGLKCYWVDLRPVFVAGDTTDGLHPTQSGGDHVGDLIWSEMVKNCIAQ